MDIHVRLRHASNYTAPADSTHPLTSLLRANESTTNAVIDTDSLPTGTEANAWFHEHMNALASLNNAPLSAEPLEAQLKHGSILTLHPPQEITRNSSGGQRASTSHPFATGNTPSLILSIDHGPDMGRTFTLGRGTYTLGRGTTNIRIADAKMSREHARIEVTGTHARLHAVPHSPPILVNGQPVTTTELTSGDRIYLGGTEIGVLSPIDAQRPPTPPDPPATPIEIKAQPSQARKLVMIVSAVLPLLLGVGMALAFNSWFFLAFSAIGAVTGLLGIFSARGGKKYQREITAASAHFEARRRGATTVPHLLSFYSPGHFSGLDRTQTTPGSRWSASMSLGITTATAPLHFSDKSPVPTTDLPPLERLPVTMDLAPGVVVTVEPSDSIWLESNAPVARWNIAAQLGALARLSVIPRVIATSTHADWLHPLQFIDGISVVPVERLTTMPRNASRVFITDNPDYLSDVLAESDAVITFAQHTNLAQHKNATPAMPHSPSPVAVHVTLGKEQGVIVDPRWAGGPTVFAVDAMTANNLLDACTPRLPAEHTRGATVESGELPDLVPLPALLNPVNPALLKGQSSIRFPIGAAASGTIDIDLERDGPHFLVAGTTGSGKSELLRSMILSLAHHESPRDLNFLMIDFKGGAGLAPFAPLPHFAGLVTDLGLESIERTLECLRAEIRYRKRLFASVNASDLNQYRQLSRVSVAASASENTVPSTTSDTAMSEHVARLVIVVDEFRMLSDASPAAVTELMRIATIGRSLGLHLILCTQRPQGAMNADIRANITTTVALRMAHPAESIDVIGTDAAASISAHTPGRAYIKVAHNEPVAFQSASSAALDSADILTPHAITSFSHWLTTDLRARAKPHKDGLAAAVRGIATRWGTDAGADVGIEHPARHPVAKPLPLSLLNQPQLREVSSSALSQSGIALGVGDLPFEQRTASVYWDPRTHSHLAIIGSPDAGASRVVAHLIAEIAQRDRHVRLYVLDGDRTLKSLSDHPGIAGYQSQESVIDAGNFVGRLHALCMDRLRDESEPPYMYLFITGWGSWSALFRQGRYTWIEDKLIELARPAYRHRLTLVTTGERELLTSKLSAEANNRIILSYGRGQEMSMLLPKMPHMAELPGRGFLQGSLVAASDDNPFAGTTIQLFERDLDSYPLTSMPHDIDAESRIEPLPPYVHQPVTVNCPKPGPWHVPIGVCAYPTRDYSLPVHLEVLTLIVGAPASGKSALLKRLTEHILGPEGKVWDCLAPATSTMIRELLAEIRTNSTSARPTVLMLDDVDRLPASAQQDLADLGHTGATIVATAGNRPGLFARCPVTLGARGGNGVVLLGPDKAGDAEAFGYRLDTEYPAPAGRAFIMGGATPIAVQTFAPGEERSMDVA